MDDTTNRIDRERCLFDIAQEQHGYFTSAQARACGYSLQLLSHHAATGRFSRARRGLYRLRDYPSYGREDVVVAWLTLGKQNATVSHETALEMLGLSDVIANAIHFTVPRERRYSTPIEGVALHTTTRAFEPGDLTKRDGIRVTSAQRAIVDAAEAGTAPDQIERAVHDALARRMIDVARLRNLAAERSERVSMLISHAIASAG